MPYLCPNATQVIQEFNISQAIIAALKTVSSLWWQSNECTVYAIPCKCQNSLLNFCQSHLPIFNDHMNSTFSSVYVNVQFNMQLRIIAWKYKGCFSADKCHSNTVKLHQEKQSNELIQHRVQTVPWKWHKSGAELSMLYAYNAPNTSAHVI